MTPVRNAFKILYICTLKINESIALKLASISTLLFCISWKEPNVFHTFAASEKQVLLVGLRNLLNKLRLFLTQRHLFFPRLLESPQTDCCPLIHCRDALFGLALLLDLDNFSQFYMYVALKKINSCFASIPMSGFQIGQIATQHKESKHSDVYFQEANPLFCFFVS